MDSARSRDGGSPARPDGPLLATNVNQAIQERAGRDDERLAAETAAILELKP